MSLHVIKGGTQDHVFHIVMKTGVEFFIRGSALCPDIDMLAYEIVDGSGLSCFCVPVDQVMYIHRIEDVGDPTVADLLDTLDKHERSFGEDKGEK